MTIIKEGTEVRKLITGLVLFLLSASAFASESPSMPTNQQEMQSFYMIILKDEAKRGIKETKKAAKALLAALEKKNITLPSVPDSIKLPLQLIESPLAIYRMARVHAQSPDKEISKSAAAYGDAMKKMLAMKVDDLLERYKENAFAAEETFNEKEIILQGKVSEVGRSVMGEPRIIFSVKNSFFDMPAYFKSSDGLSKIKKGQEVFFIGRVTNGAGGRFVIHDAELIP